MVGGNEPGGDVVFFLRMNVSEIYRFNMYINITCKCCKQNRMHVSNHMVYLHHNIYINILFHSYMS